MPTRNIKTNKHFTVYNVITDNMTRDWTSNALNSKPIDKFLLALVWSIIIIMNNNKHEQAELSFQCINKIKIKPQ